MCSTYLCFSPLVGPPFHSIPFRYSLCLSLCALDYFLFLFFPFFLFLTAIHLLLLLLLLLLVFHHSLRILMHHTCAPASSTQDSTCYSSCIYLFTRRCTEVPQSPSYLRLDFVLSFFSRIGSVIRKKKEAKYENVLLNVWIGRPSHVNKSQVFSCCCYN